MKKFFVVFLCFCFVFLAVGCESDTAVRAGHISEITGAMSTDYAIKVLLDKDDRVKEKFVDLQIKSSEEEQFLSFGEENGERFVVCLPRKDYWYNLTYLISQTNGTSGQEKYKSYENFGDRVYIFNSQNDVKLVFRVVAGETKINDETKEEILVLGEPISDEVKVDVKKKK